MKENKIKLTDNMSCRDFAERSRDYEILDALSKDELITRYMYRMENIPFWAFMGGMILMGIIAVVAVAL